MSIRKILSYILFALLLVSAHIGYCSEEQTYTITETQYQQLMNNLTELEKINQTLIENLNQSEMESMQVLIESKKQKEQLAELKNQLMTSEKQTEKAMTSLEKANKELENLSKSLKKLEQQKSDLKSQRNIISGIAGGLLIALIAK